MKAKIITFAVAAIIPFTANSQVSQENRFPQKYVPQEFQSYKYTGTYFNKKSVYTLRQATVCETPGPIRHIVLNPSGANVATVWEKGKAKTGKLTIYNFWLEHDVVENPKLKYNVSSVCFSPDARALAVCDTEGTVHFLDAKKFTETNSFSIGFAATSMEISDNLDFLAATDGHHVDVRILKTGELRKTISSEVNIIDFLFSPDNSFLSILTSDGYIIEYDIMAFLPENEISALGTAAGFSLHKDCKYYAVVTGEHTIALVNRLNPADRQYIEDSDNLVGNPLFIDDSKGWLGYSTEKNLVYKQITVMKPNYNKLISDEIDTRMKEWAKRMPGESLEEYNLRVNEETRMKQLSIFEEEISTRLAGDQLSCSQISLGEYNPQDQILEVNFDSMPPIYLNVPQDRLGDFRNASDLEFRNVRYGHKSDDTFELVYAEVYNKRTGAAYTFDNRERKSLEYMKLNDNFVPIDVLQQANMEELSLENIKNEIVTRALSDNKITNHTNIAVTTNVEKNVDANGNKVIDYKVGFTYDVLPGFSGSEDFAPGDYSLDKSGAASSMSTIIKEAFEGNFAQYMKPGKKVKIKITGMADNLKIRNRIPYDGRFGDFVNEPVHGDNQLYAITVTKESGITENDQLALVRAAAVKDYIDNKIPQFSQMDKQYEYHIQLSDAEGGAFRRISVEFTFYDAF